MNPHLLPKLRSEALMRACGSMPCTLRIASLIGLPCAGQSTVVGAHVGNLGKGMSTKVSDLFAVAACATCHDLYDRRHEGWKVLADRYPAAVAERALAAVMETQGRWVEMGLIEARDQDVAR